MNKRGFSLVEIMVGLAMLGGVSLGVLKLSDNQRKAFEYHTSKGVELDIYNQVRYVLSSKNACRNTLENLNITDLNGVAVPVIKNDNDGDFITNNQTFGNSARVSSFTLIPSGLATVGAERISTAILRVSIERLKGLKNVFSKDIYLTVKTDSSNVIQECLTEEDSVFNVSKKEMCLSVGGTFVDGPPEVCNLNCPSTTPMTLVQLNSGSLLSAACLDKFKNDILDNRYTSKTDLDGDGIADNMTGNLTVNGDVLSTASLEATTSISVGSNTHTFQATTCPTGQSARGFDNSGNPICVNITCGTNSYFRGIDSAGNPICASYNPTRSCSSNQFVSRVNTDGSVVCANKPTSSAATCPSGSYMRGINSSGAAICATELGLSNFTCPTGQAVYRLNNGSYSCRIYSDNNVFGSSCPSGQAIKGFDNAGAPTCVTIPTPPACTPVWTPDPINTCPGTNVAQTNQCDSTTRNVDGTKASGCGPASCPLIQTNGAAAFTNGLCSVRLLPNSDIAHGTSRVFSTAFCTPGVQQATGSITYTCNNGSITQSAGSCTCGVGGGGGGPIGGTWITSAEDVSCSALGIGACGSPTPVPGGSCPTQGVICAQSCSGTNIIVHECN